jgi:hypothetical protein
VNDPLAKLRSGVSTLCYLSLVTTNIIIIRGVYRFAVNSADCRP